MADSALRAGGPGGLNSALAQTLAQSLKRLISSAAPISWHACRQALTDKSPRMSENLRTRTRPSAPPREPPPSSVRPRRQLILFGIPRPRRAVSVDQQAGTIKVAPNHLFANWQLTSR